MKLIFALGNPEPKYNGTRHNIGFFVADQIAKQINATWQPKTKFKALIAEGESFIIAKPTTYYNLVGESARAIADFYKIAPEDILVIHDDISLPFGTVRTRVGGSGAGNNGIKSIIQHIGHNTARIRIGTWNELADHIDSADFVLSKFTRAEQIAIIASVPTVNDIVAQFLNGDFQATTHKQA